MVNGHSGLPIVTWESTLDDGNDPQLALTYSQVGMKMVADPNGEWVKVSKYRYQKINVLDNLQSRVNDANLQQAFQHDKYNRPCKGVTIDVYDVLSAFNVTNPALQHLIKKALAVGQRGHKDKTEDLNDILTSAKRAIELEKQQ